jgi:hypothetical protein
MRTADSPVWLIVLIDALLTYPYVFAAEALMPPPEGPHATTAYWMTQAWVYALIAPVAIVAAWRGARQVQHAWAGRPRWWRLPVEAMACALPAALMLLMSGAGVAEVVLGSPQLMALAGGLGLLLTCVNYPLARLLHPRGTRAAPRPAQADFV